MDKTSEAGKLMCTAIETNDIEKVKELLSAGMSIFEYVKREFYAISAAKELERLEIIRLMLAAQPSSEIDPGKDDIFFALLFLAVEVGQFEFVRKWKYDCGLPLDFKYPAGTGESSLHHAVRYLHYTDDWLMVKYLLEEGLDPNIKDDNGNTPLHFAAKFMSRSANSLQILKPVIYLLVKAGGDINARNSSGETPLQLCALHELNCIFDLLQFGADINIKNNEGLTFWDDVCDKKIFNQTFHDTLMVYECSRILALHVATRRTFDLKVTNRIVEQFPYLRQYCDTMAEMRPGFNIKYIKDKLSEDNSVDFANKNVAEREKMERKKLDGSCSLYDVLFMDQHQLYRLTRKECYRNYFENHKYKEDFPISWYLLEHKYSLGVVRGLLLPLAKKSLYFLNIPVPQVFLEMLPLYFSNDELKSFIETTHELNPELYTKNFKLSVFLMHENTFNDGILTYPENGA